MEGHSAKNLWRWGAFVYKAKRVPENTGQWEGKKKKNRQKEESAYRTRKTELEVGSTRREAIRTPGSLGSG